MQGRPPRSDVADVAVDDEVGTRELVGAVRAEEITGHAEVHTRSAGLDTLPVRVVVTVAMVVESIYELGLRFAESNIDHTAW